MKTAIETVLTLLVSVLLPKLTPEIIKKGLDAFFNTIEEAVHNSDTQIDDITVIPVIKLLRETLNVPDSNPNN